MRARGGAGGSDDSRLTRLNLLEGDSEMTERPEFLPILETETCSRCGQGTGWEFSETEGWLSTCCARPPKALPADAS